MATKLISSAHFSALPSSYIRPESERPKKSEIVESADIRVIDLSSEDRELIIKQIGDACKEYGFFQVVNHGIPKQAVDDVLRVTREFYHQPVEEKMKMYSEDMSKEQRLSTSYNINAESSHIWRDYMRLHCYPLEKYMPDWPSSPPAFKEIVSKYAKEVRELGFRLQELFSLSLGLEKDALRKIFEEDQAQHMAFNYYPPCPEPDLAIGLASHTDSDILTVLLPDSDVSGLQVLKDGKWLAVHPHPDALIINIADQVQVVSNDKYKSNWHRAVVNSDRARISIASFICPAYTAKIKAPAEISDEEGRHYRDFTYKEYYDVVWSQDLDQEHPLEYFRIRK